MKIFCYYNPVNTHCLSSLRQSLCLPTFAFLPHCRLYTTSITIAHTGQRGASGGNRRLCLDFNFHSIMIITLFCCCSVFDRYGCGLMPVISVGQSNCRLVLPAAPTNSLVLVPAAHRGRMSINPLHTLVVTPVPALVVLLPYAGHRCPAYLRVAVLLKHALGFLTTCVPL